MHDLAQNNLLFVSSYNYLKVYIGTIIGIDNENHFYIGLKWFPMFPLMKGGKSWLFSTQCIILCQPTHAFFEKFSKSPFIVVESVIGQLLQGSSDERFSPT